MMKSQIKAAIAADRAVLGHLVTIPSVAVVQALAGSGIDFVMIDMEHAPLGIETAAAMIAATNGTATAPIVRVPGAGSGLVKPVLDSGAFGIVFPHIESAEEARAAVAVSRYAPQGARGYGPAYAALRWGVAPVDYIRAANTEVLSIVLIESQAAITTLDDILRVEGIDIALIARGDLSQELGVPGQFHDPRLKDLVADAERRIRAQSRVTLGGVAFTPDEATAMISAGYRFLVLGSDAALLQRSAAAQLAAVRS